MPAIAPQADRRRRQGRRRIEQATKWKPWSPRAPRGVTGPALTVNAGHGALRDACQIQWPGRSGRRDGWRRSGLRGCSPVSKAGCSRPHFACLLPGFDCSSVGMPLVCKVKRKDFHVRDGMQCFKAEQLIHSGSLRFKAQWREYVQCSEPGSRSNQNFESNMVQPEQFFVSLACLDTEAFKQIRFQ